MNYFREIFFLMGSKKKQLPLIVFCFVFLSFMDVVGIGLIGPYISIIMEGETKAGMIGQFLLFFGFENTREELLVNLGLSLVALFLIKAVLAIIINRVLIKFGAQIQVHLRSNLMKSYQMMPYSTYLARNSSEYIYAINNLVGMFQQVTVAFLKLTSDLILVSAIIILLAFQDIFALLVLLTLLFGLIIIFDRIFKFKLKRYGQVSNIAAAELLKSIAQGMEGFKEIRILGKEKLFYDNVLNASLKLAKYQTKEGVISTAPRFLLEFFMVSFIVLLIVVTIWAGNDLKSIIVTLAMFSVASLRLLPSVSSISGNVLMFRYHRDAISKLYKDIDSLKDINQTTLIEKNRSRPFKKITLDNVNFSYSAESQVILENISLQINKGDCIGIIGPSGSGKTTLVDVLLGLLEIKSGEIKYNGIKIQKSIHELQSKVAYLPQEVFLIDDTIRHNVALGIQDDKIDNEKVLDSLKKARLIDFVDKLPLGVETILGERGSRLSGGQRQRISLARAFYEQREFLIMDEATSSLDTKTEIQIVDEIRYLRGKITIIIIAHRLSTLQYCDSIYVLGDGQIVKSGTPKDILDLDKI
jgi:ABC-type multidrug transport system fused ATPase/permease subunit